MGGGGGGEAMSSQVEREVKLGVWPGFRLPELDDLGDGLHAVERPARDLDATYYDTPDLRLARAGVTLRRRSGEGWTLKLPTGEGTSEMLSRRELTAGGGLGEEDGAIPEELSTLVVAWVRTSSLGPVARLHTLRRSVNLLDGLGLVAAEIVDDEVSVLHGDRLALRFREVEVELGRRADPELLDVIVAHLRSAGANPADPTPKVVRALGPRASDPPELADPDDEDKGTAAGVIRSGLRSSARRLLAHDAGVRLGDDPEDVHQARVATRRLRSDLRTYKPLLDEEWAKDLRSELKWIAAGLGEVRDADVLLEGFQAGVAGLGPLDAQSAENLLGRLHDQRTAARERLLGMLDDRRYALLLDRLVDAMEPHRPEHVPAVPAGAPAVISSGLGWLRPEAEGPAEEVLPTLVRKPWKHLLQAAEAVEPDGPDEELHQVRIRAKRCRYAAEVAAMAVGKPAKRLAGAVADLQDVLGEHQDAVVAEAWLRSVAHELTPAEALVAGQLIAGQRTIAARTRGSWPEAWDRASRRKLRGWLTE
ncbi:MAG: CYTH and CHAD domain-containing protein [Actinomycetota bacterium]|nr:CYTH and CHAD domain-containing protein [Actinomycetota bacterium]